MTRIPSHGIYRGSYGEKQGNREEITLQLSQVESDQIKLTEKMVHTGSER
jgi:hypothetical protein